LHEIDAVPALNKKLKHDIEVVVDRVVVRGDIQSRLADSLETALGLADGIAFAENADGKGEGVRTVFSAKFACPVSGFTIDEIEPRLFSFNNPFGACPSCDGLGVKMHFNPELVVPDPDLSIEDGAVAPWSSSSVPSPYYLMALKGVLAHYGAKIDVPWKKLPAKVRDGILNGTGEDEVTIKFNDGNRKFETRKRSKVC